MIRGIIKIIAWIVENAKLQKNPMIPINNPLNSSYASTGSLTRSISLGDIIINQQKQTKGVSNTSLLPQFNRGC